MNYQNPRFHDTVISPEAFAEIEERETDKQNAPKFLQKANTARAEFVNKQVRKEGRNPLNQGDMEEWLNKPSEPFSPAAQMVIAHCGEIMGDHPVVNQKCCSIAPPGEKNEQHTFFLNSMNICSPITPKFLISMHILK